MTLLETSAPESYFVDRFKTRPKLDGPSWLRPLQMAAMSRFSELGFPTRHDEEWRYTDIRPITELTYIEGVTVPMTAEQLQPFLYAGMHAIVFINGKYSPEHSPIGGLPNGVVVSSLSEAFINNAELLQAHLGRYAGFEQQPFIALNTALFTEGALISIARNAVLETPIQILYLSTETDTPLITYPRTLIVASENSQATIIESYAGLGQGTYFANAVTEVSLAENAIVDHYKLHQESGNAFHIAAMQIQLANRSNFSSHSFTNSGAIVRNDLCAVLDGEGICCTLNGLYLANGKRVVDNHTTIDHAKPNCESHEVYKGILDDKSKGIFNGKIFVRVDAQKTDAKQTNKTLLLSEDAQINTKPQLEIFADDVKCTHGATVGQLDANQLFYLRARGISLTDARSLLVYAFASDIVSRIKVEAIRTQLDSILLSTLPKR